MEVTYGLNNSNLQHTAKAFRRRKNDIDLTDKYPKPKNYTETLLREYKILVELLSRLDEATFSKLYSEVNSAIDQLKEWLEQKDCNKTLEIYWTMRQLRQRIHNHIKQTSKSNAKLRSDTLVLPIISGIC